MKYVERYPNAVYLDEVEPGLMKGSKGNKCWNCEKEASFIDIDFMAYFCSDKCREQKWEEYRKASCNS